MTGVRNGVLGRLVTGSGGAHDVFTVQSGITVLLKDIHLLNSGNAAAQIDVFCQSGDQVVNAVLLSSATDAGKSVAWDGWLALMPGDRLILSTNGPGVHVWASGAALPGVGL